MNKNIESLDITKANIILDTRNNIVTFWNIYIKSYYYPIKETNINYLEIINILIEKLMNKSINKKFFILVNNSESQKSYW